MSYLKDSFSDAIPGESSLGQKANDELIRHSDRLVEKFYTCGDAAWCYVGNGLSNQTFIKGPEGIIAIDTGECIEEMRSALASLRTVTDLPVVACIYTHFHYVNGTRAIVEESGEATLPIYGHAGIAANLERFGGEVGPRSSRGLVHQFAIMLPAEGEDGLVNVGLGRFFRHPGHAPFTPGYMPATETFEEPVSMTIAGLAVEITPAASDATDSITIWFPDLGVCVNNLVWPALFNVFAIRGEEYRDSRVLLNGLSHLESLPIEHLLGAHGPPLSGTKEIVDVIADYGDSIRYMWDQSVRGFNRGLTLDEVASSVQLPDRFNRTYFTRQLYGLVEHHVKQIHSGLFGWFDEDTEKLFPLAPLERATRLIQGFGGAGKVRGQVDQALAEGDFRWAIELSGWLVRTGDHSEDAARLGAGLRGVAQRTTSANVRNWCLTRALELEGQIDLSRFRVHRFGYKEVLAAKPDSFIKVLRVLLDPVIAEGIDFEVCWQFDTGEKAGLKIRGQVAIPTDGENADARLALSHDTWAQLLAQKTTLQKAADEGLIKVDGDLAETLRFFTAFDPFTI